MGERYNNICVRGGYLCGNGMLEKKIRGVQKRSRPKNVSLAAKIWIFTWKKGRNVNQDGSGGRRVIKTDLQGTFFYACHFSLSLNSSMAGDACN